MGNMGPSNMGNNIGKLCCLNKITKRNIANFDVFLTQNKARRNEKNCAHMRIEMTARHYGCKESPRGREMSIMSIRRFSK